MLTTLTKAMIGQFRGRAKAWKRSFIASCMVLILWFYLFRPTCDLMFYPAEVGRNYAVAWACLFALIGLTNRGKLVCGIVILLWLAPRPLIEYRIPTNEARTVRRLGEIQTTLKSAQKPMRELTDIVNPDLIYHGQMSGYVFEYLPQFSGRGSLEHYLVKARPFCYCLTGQRSFALEDTGAIHYTPKDRAATVSDPVLRAD